MIFSGITGLSFIILRHSWGFGYRVAAKLPSGSATHQPSSDVNIAHSGIGIGSNSANHKPATVLSVSDVVFLKGGQLTSCRGAGVACGTTGISLWHVERAAPPTPMSECINCSQPQLLLLRGCKHMPGR